MSNIGLLPALEVHGGVQLGEDLVFSISFFLADDETPLSLAGLTLTSTIASAVTGETIFVASVGTGTLIVSGAGQNVLTWAILAATVSGWEPGADTISLLATDGTYTKQVFVLSSVTVGAGQEWRVRQRTIPGQINSVASQSNAVIAAASATASAAAAAQSLAAMFQTPVLADADTMIAEPGYYLVNTPNVTMTFPEGPLASVGPVKIKDITGSAYPNIRIAGPVDPTASVINTKGGCLTFTWSPDLSQWIDG